MTAPDIDTLSSYGGALQDLSPVIDPTTDRPASGANQEYASAAAMTHTCPRALARITWAGTGTPTLTTHEEQWNNGNNSAPTAARTAVGKGTLTYPATVYDEIPSGSPGYNAAGHALNMRFALGGCEDQTTLYHVQAYMSAPNVISFAIYNSSGTLADPASSVIVLRAT